MITRVEADDTTPWNNYYRQLNIADGTQPTKKRTESEIHYLVTNQPVVFYSQRSDLTNDPNCPGYPGVNKLMRARTGSLWVD